MGLIVLSAETGSPSDQAGWLVGDVLLSLDGHRVTDVDEVQSALDPSRVGQTVTAVLVRAGAKIERPVRVGERPKESA